MNPETLERLQKEMTHDEKEAVRADAMAHSF